MQEIQIRDLGDYDALLNEIDALFKEGYTYVEVLGMLEIVKAHVMDEYLRRREEES